jgi:hypothetical protein
MCRMYTYKQCRNRFSSVTAQLLPTPWRRRKLSTCFLAIECHSAWNLSVLARFGGQWISFPRSRPYVWSKTKIELRHLLNSRVESAETLCLSLSSVLIHRVIRNLFCSLSNRAVLTASVTTRPKRTNMTVINNISLNNLERSFLNLFQYIISMFILFSWRTLKKYADKWKFLNRRVEEIYLQNDTYIWQINFLHSYLHLGAPIDNSVILLVALGPGVYSASNRNAYQKHKNNVSGE